MPLRLGIDVACRAAHQVSLADEQGRFIWSGRRFRTTSQDLERLWAMLPGAPTRRGLGGHGTDPQRVGAAGRVVSAPRRRGGAGATGTVGGSAPLLRQAHQVRPAGLPAAGPGADAAPRRPATEQGLGPGDALRRAAKLHSTLRSGAAKAWPDWTPCWRSSGRTGTTRRRRPGQPDPVAVPRRRYADPHTVKRLGRARLARFLYRHSRGAWGEAQAEAFLAAAQETLQLWAGGELDFPDLAEDIAIEARLACS